jgi:hypothetical protein
MSKYLLKNIILTAAITTALTGCGPDKGTDLSFTNTHVVTYASEDFNVSLTEGNGVVAVDLLEGAMADGKDISGGQSTSPIFIKEILFATPEDPNFVTGQSESDFTNTSPFTLDNAGTLSVNTDAFDGFGQGNGFQSSLFKCFSEDLRGGPRVDDLPTPDGYDDFPSSITYVITYVVDNGFEPAPGVEDTIRTLRLTINAGDDPVTAVSAADLSVASGDTVAMTASTLPVIACNPGLDYSIADTSIATVDDDGMVTGLVRGETDITITSQENADHSATVKITVTPGFNLAITNQPKDDLGAATGAKEVPSCGFAGLSVEPTIVADTLTGAYTFSWTSNNPDLPFSQEVSDGAFGATGLISTGTSTDVGKMTNVTVGFGSGYTGGTQSSDVLSQEIDLTVVKNNYCDPGVSEHAAGFFVDFDLDKAGANWGGSGTAVANTAESLDGTSLQITAGAEPINLTQQVWNNQRNYHSATYGLGGGSVGNSYKFSVWAKLDTLPAGPVTMKHVLLPWNCDGCTGLTGFPGRRHLAGEVKADLKATTEWQLVEFINPLNNTDVWSVPAHWNVGTAVFQFYEIEGIAEGDVIYLDSQAAVSVE